MSNDPDYEATQKARRAKRDALRKLKVPCINCGKAWCDGHDGDSWHRCAQRYHTWSLQIERRCLDLLKQHGIEPPSPLREPTT